MKKKSLLLILLSLMLILSGCTSKVDKKNDENYTADQDFIIDLGKSLESRWAIQDVEFEQGSDKHKEHFTNSVNTEYKPLSEYKDLNFKDKTLGEKAKAYIGFLENQLEALDYMQVDYDKYLELWENAYNQRTKAIADFAENYGLTINEKYSETLNEMKLNAKTILEKEAFEAKVSEMVESVKFEKTKESYDWSTYEAVIENITNCEFDYFYFQVSLISSDGIVIESTSTSSINNWKPGQKAKFEFSTDKDFETIEFSGEYYVDEQ